MPLLVVNTIQHDERGVICQTIRICTQSYFARLQKPLNFCSKRKLRPKRFIFRRRKRYLRSFQNRKQRMTAQISGCHPLFFSNCNDSQKFLHILEILLQYIPYASSMGVAWYACEGSNKKYPHALMYDIIGYN